MFTINYIMSLFQGQSNVDNTIDVETPKSKSKPKPPLIEHFINESDYGTHALSDFKEAPKINIDSLLIKTFPPKVYIESRIKFECDGKECILKIRHRRYPIK